MKKKNSSLTGGGNPPSSRKDRQKWEAPKTEPAPSSRTDATPFPEDECPVVGIGASAGGLAAFEAFFSGMPADVESGMAFVLVQHLAPDHKSILTDLISRYTRMKVFEVEDGMVVRSNCAYIIPPNRDMSFVNGTLRLAEPSAPRGQRLPIDYFLRSLALDRRERAICVILSGTGSDGTQGALAIKGEGGIIMAQEPGSAEYDGMPRSAIATGQVDFILPPSEMPKRLMSYVSYASRRQLNGESTAPAGMGNALKMIFSLLRAQTGHDFSLYKSNTVFRRIERRMAVHLLESIDEYAVHLEKNPAEVDALLRDLLIRVTGFFRDGEVFSALEEQVIPKLFAGRPPDSVMRIWVPGCSTGEEAYSIAILLLEYMDSTGQSYSVQIFATDIDSRAIETARAGVYPASIMADIAPERLSRFFIIEPGGSACRINKNIRDMLIFSEQDVIKDPPFSRLDLISCRNLMIYMSSDLQKKLIPLFYYALNPGGFLLLGSSETVGEYNDLFVALDRKMKLFLRGEDIHGRMRPSLNLYSRSTVSGDSLLSRMSRNKTFPEKSSLRELAEQALLLEFAPAGALVNSHGDLLYLHGRTGMYLEPAPGEATAGNVLKMAREGLRHDLTMALHKAVSTKETVRHPCARVKTNGDFIAVDLTVIPIPVTPGAMPGGELYMVSLKTALPCAVPEAVPPFSAAGQNADIEEYITALRHELRIKEEFLQTAIGELELSNEELKSSNEEMQSINEELQSTNEELETSKEELQSVNEELAIINTELQTKVADLSRANNDMNNLLSGTGIATVFVDHCLRILRFTPTATNIINLIMSDVGRPVGHIVSNLTGYDRLLEDTQAVLDTLVLKEVEVQTKGGAWYMMRILPYRTVDNVIEGAVITFVDVSARRRAEEKIQNLLSEKEVILKEVHHRIKNNMSTMMSMLALQAGKMENSAAINALKDAESRMQSMMLLYDKLYLSDNFREVSIKEYLSSLLFEIVGNFPDSVAVKIDMDIEDFTISSKILFSLGIIVNELMTNIMKYAFTQRDSGLITASASAAGDLATVIIQDNGNGIPEAITIENSTGFGLMLVKLLTKQIGGTVEIERRNGTRIILKFKK